MMVIALLVLIVLILLFGAGVVKGWVANLVTLGCGGLAIIAALLWVGHFSAKTAFNMSFGRLSTSCCCSGLSKWLSTRTSRQ